MNHVKKLNQYFKELARTYHLFFKSAPLIATLVLLLAPLQAVVPLIAVAAGQKVIDQVTNHSPFMEMIIVWIVATAFQQFLPSLSTMVQGILTDKLTGFINISLMKNLKIYSQLGFLTTVNTLMIYKCFEMMQAGVQLI